MTTPVTTVTSPLIGVSMLFLYFEVSVLLRNYVKFLEQAFRVPQSQGREAPCNNIPNRPFLSTPPGSPGQCREPTNDRYLLGDPKQRRSFFFSLSLCSGSQATSRSIAYEQINNKLRYPYPYPTLILTAYVRTYIA